MYSELNTLSDIHTFTYQKTLLHIFLLLISKVVKSLQCILNEENLALINICEKGPQ